MSADSSPASSQFNLNQRRQRMNVYQEFLNRRDCILLLVDIQKVMLDLCVDPDRTVFNAAALIEIAGLFEIPVLCSVQNSVRLGGFLPELTSKISQPQISDKLQFNCF